MTTIVVSTFADGQLVRKDNYSTTTYTVARAQQDALDRANNFGILGLGNQNFYQKQVEPQPELQPKEPTPTTPDTQQQVIPKDSKLKQVKYISKNKYTKPKSTPGGEFIYKETGKDYKGYYFEDYKKRYFAGSSPDSRGSELIKVKSPIPGQLLDSATTTLIQALKGLFRPTVKKSDKNKGTVTRYFVQAKNTKKITELDKDNYLLVKKTQPNYALATIEWIIKGPAEDKDFNGYPFEGAASKNKKAIQALESQIPGISTYVTDYSYLVEEPVPKTDTLLESQTVVEKDAQTQLENDRKANFDLRK
jgi:hypothetical protein